MIPVVLDNPVGIMGLRPLVTFVRASRATSSSTCRRGQVCEAHSSAGFAVRVSSLVGAASRQGIAAAKNFSWRARSRFASSDRLLAWPNAALFKPRTLGAGAWSVVIGRATDFNYFCSALQIYPLGIRSAALRPGGARAEPTFMGLFGVAGNADSRNPALLITDRHNFPRRGRSSAAVLHCQCFPRSARRIMTVIERLVSPR